MSSTLIIPAATPLDLHLSIPKARYNDAAAILHGIPSRLSGLGLDPSAVHLYDEATGTASTPSEPDTSGSLAGSRTGRVIILAGQSNALGYLTAPAPSAKPAGVTYYLNGALQAGWPAGDHGPEVGLALVLPTCTIIKRAIGGTSVADWMATHAAALIADVAGTGLTPTAMLWMQGERDAQVEADALGYQAACEELFAVLRAAWGAELGIIVTGVCTENPAVCEFHATVRAAQKSLCAAGSRVRYLDTSNLGVRNDGHLTGPGLIEIGADAARIFAAAGIGT